MAEIGRGAAVMIGLVLLGVAAAGCSLTSANLPTTPTRIATGVPPSPLVPPSASAPPSVSALPSVPAVPSVPAPLSTPVPTIQPENTPMPPGMATRAIEEEQAMTLTVLYDNNPHDPRLQTGWGFAAWLEYGGRTVLFDTGAGGAVLLDNMAALGLDPTAIDMVVLSHAHDDHTGGLADLLAVNPGIPVYLPQAFPHRFKAQARAAGAVVVEVNAPLEILPGLWSTGQMGTDAVEQALVAATGKGLVVVTGCAHPGVDQMVARAAQVVSAQQIDENEIALVVGGFHLGSASRERVAQIVVEFRRLGVQRVAPCHCTGDLARELFLAAYGDGYYACGVGWQWQSQVPTWRPAHQGIPARIGVAAVAVAPGDARVIYLAAYGPDGVYRSADGGDSWQAESQGLEGHAPLAIAVHPNNPDVVWAGTMGGGYRTADGGQSWEPMAGLPQAPIYTLAVAPGGGTLYAAGEATAIWRSGDGGQTWATGGSPNFEVSTLSLVTRTDGAVLAGTAGEGVWISHDAGQSWQQAAGELADAHVSTLAIAPDGRLYALASGQLYLSSNGGDTWETARPPGFEALSFGLASGERLYLGSKGEGLAVSEDGGQSWTLEGKEFRHADITCLAGDPVTPGRAFLGTRHHGLYRTDDGGTSWTLVSAEIGQPVITALAQDPVDPDVLYAGALDGVYRSDNGGELWSLVSADMGKLLVQSLAVSPTGDRLYAGTDSGLYMSQDGGATWHWAERDTGGIAVFNVVIDPHDAGRIYAGSWGHNILLSTDGGQAWAPIHHGLETLSVHALAIDLQDPYVLYAGTVEAVYRSTDGGGTWQASALGNRPLTTLALTIDSGEPARVYAGTTDGVYLSADRGRTWRPAGQKSLPATVTALTSDDAGTLLAGTEHHGLYRSTDGGTSWQPWGIEAAGVYAILIDRAGTTWLGTDRGIFTDR